LIKVFVFRLNQDFLDRSIKSADIVTVDFKQPESAGRTIKKWAQTKTKGGLKIDDISYAPSTKIALTSAIYFKGKFVYTFQPAQPGIFNTPEGPITTNMMYMKRKFRAGNMGNYARWVAIPYESNDALVIILPNENVNVNIAMQSITEYDLNQVMNGLESESTKANVNLTMPKFHFESTTNLIDPLKKVSSIQSSIINYSNQPFHLSQMGLTTLFTPNAELPYLSNSPDVQISNAQQQASFDVSEDGTVLIAFTNLNVMALSFQQPIPDVEFNVNRPFIAMIAEIRRGFPYVFAKVTNPSK
jgi:serpin B